MTRKNSSLPSQQMSAIQSRDTKPLEQQSTDGHLGAHRRSSRALSISEVAATLGIGRTTVYKLINASRLDARKLGRRTLILTDSVDRLLTEAVDAE